MIIDICLTFVIQLFILLASILLLVKIPPINSFYGYRTRKSSANEESWKFANKTAAISLIAISISSMALGSLLLILKYCLSMPINFMWFATATLIGIFMLPILITEILLYCKNKRNEK